MKKFLLLVLSACTLTVSAAHAARLEDFLDRKELQKKIRETIADQDITFDTGLGSLNLIDGINISNSYHYDVEASYINKFYSRIDKWDVKAGINVGEVLKDLVDVPFSFSVNRQNSFFFVRQFPRKIEAIKALPYGPNKLPLNANLALKNLNAGDFVSMPANLNVAVGASASTSLVSPVVVSANVGVYYVISGEFIIQVFKIDETHVRLKLISQNSRSSGASTGVGASFNFFGVRIIDHEIERLFERDLAQLGTSYTPGAQFIVDYVFDLKDPEAQMAYNQILSSTLKFKDIVVAEQLINAKDIKDKLISSYEKADEIFEADRGLDPKDRRVNRIFKGFNNYKGFTHHLKLSFLVTSMTKDKTFTQNKVTFIDKKEKSMEFYYPTFSKYYEGHLGKWIFELKDQSFQNNFGLIPQFNNEDDLAKNPDIGLTFERKDRYFTTYEQKAIEAFLIGQIPAELARDIDFSQWNDGVKKYDSRIFFQMVLKAQGFDYLKNISAEELRKKILIYVKEKRKIQVIDGTDSEDETKIIKLEDFLFINRYIEKERLLNLANSLAEILKNKNNDSKDMLKRLVELNEKGVFDKIGIGFLISLLPQDKLRDLVYLKLEMFGKDLKPISAEVGKLNYQALYIELNEVQSRLSNRSYDLRLSEQDKTTADMDIGSMQN